MLSFANDFQYVNIEFKRWLGMLALPSVSIIIDVFTGSARDKTAKTASSFRN